jgi:hypothetical protein
MDITRKRGDTKPLTFTLTDTETWEPANLTGCSFTLTVDSSQNPSGTTTRLFQLTGVPSAPLLGKVELSLSDAQADHVGVFYYWLKVIDPLGLKLTVASGQYVFEPAA